MAWPGGASSGTVRERERAGPAPRRARLTWRGAGLAAGSVTERESDAPRGQVIGSEPREGAKIPFPATVNLIVSSGPTTVALPDVTGQSLSAARPLLEQLGFRVRVITDSLSTMPLNTVVSQAPAAGRRIAAGSSVTLTVAGAPSPTTPPTPPTP
jgi:serine/threonine-protein kinase